ncbi:MAG TPA: hypothetical protein VHX19_04745 [Stellaceae bacterium]|nr:hypothetical protein [Stellaceae bacterium]
MEMRLPCRAHLRHRGAVLRGCGAGRVETLCQLARIREQREFGFGAGAFGSGFVTIGDKPLLGLLECRKTSGDLRLLALARGNLFAGRFDSAKGFAMRLPRLRFRRGLGFEVGADLIGFRLQDIGGGARGGDVL